MTPLVLLHAFPLSRLMYEDVADQLTREVFVPDLPGFGGAPIPTGEPSLDRYADHVASEMRRAGIGAAVVAGTSMGGYTAMALCRRHPDLVAGLGLIDTRAAADAEAGAQGRRAMADAMEAGITTDPLVQNVLSDLRRDIDRLGIEIEVTAAEDVEVVSDAPVIVTARTYNAAKEGTFGQSLPGVTADDGDIKDASLPVGRAASGHGAVAFQSVCTKGLALKTA